MVGCYECMNRCNRRNLSWSLTCLLRGCKAIGVKLIFKTKFNQLGEVDKLKACLVVNGYLSMQGIDYTKVFKPVARMEMVRIIKAFVAQNRWKLQHLDVKSAFLYGELNEDVYVEKP